MAPSDEDKPDSKQRFSQFRIRNLLVFTLAIGMIYAAFQRRNPKDQHAIDESLCHSNLHRIILALHNYHSANGSLPPAYVRGPDGAPWHSWRTLILPYLDPSDPVWKSYSFSEPWNGPNNRRLLQEMHDGTFICPAGSERQTDFTSYVAIVGPDTVFPGAKGRSFSEIKLPDPIFVLEITNSDIHFLEPRDVSIEAIGQSQANSLRLNKPHLGALRYVTLNGGLGELPPGTSIDQIKRLAGIGAVESTPDGLAQPELTPTKENLAIPAEDP